MCNEICSVPACHEGMLQLYGPVPLDYGCCEQDAGDGAGSDYDMQKNFSLWFYHTPNTEYNLMIRKSTSTVATPSLTARWVASVRCRTPLLILCRVWLPCEPQTRAA